VLESSKIITTYCIIVIHACYNYNYIINALYNYYMGPGVAQWLRRCATSRTVPGSIPGGVNGFFSDISPFGRAMVLGSNQQLENKYQEHFLGVKAAGA
jgi:hypothetical protein